MKKRWIFTKLNDEPLIMDDELVNEDDEESSLFFNYEDEHHYMNDIISRHSVWFPPIEDLPDFIHGIDETDYWNPLFVELIEDIDFGEYGIAFNVYRMEAKDETENSD